VQDAALDQCRGYDTALPAATVVLDLFHAIKLGQNTSTRCAAAHSRTLWGTGVAAGTRFTDSGLVLLRGAERHTLRSYTRLLAGLAAGGSGGQVATTWIATQELRHVYGARDVSHARARLFTFYTVYAGAGVPELHRVPAPSAPGRTSCSPTFTPAGPATGQPKR